MHVRPNHHDARGVRSGPVELLPVAKLVEAFLVSQQDENYNHMIRCCDAYVKAVKILCKRPVVDEGEGDVAIDMDHPQYEG